MLVADCPCGTHLVLDEGLAGRIKECPTCQKPIQVTAPGTLPAAPDDGIHMGRLPGLSPGRNAGADLRLNFALFM